MSRIFFILYIEGGMAYGHIVSVVNRCAVGSLRYFFVILTEVV